MYQEEHPRAAISLDEAQPVRGDLTIQLMDTGGDIALLERAYREIEGEPIPARRLQCHEVAIDGDDAKRPAWRGRFVHLKIVNGDEGARRAQARAPAR